MMLKTGTAYTPMPAKKFLLPPLFEFLCSFRVGENVISNNLDDFNVRRRKQRNGGNVVNTGPLNAGDGNIGREAAADTGCNQQVAFVQFGQKRGKYQRKLSAVIAGENAAVAAFCETTGILELMSVISVTRA